MWMTGNIQEVNRPHRPWQLSKCMRFPLRAADCSCDRVQGVEIAFNSYAAGSCLSSVCLEQVSAMAGADDPALYT